MRSLMKKFSLYIISALLICSANIEAVSYSSKKATIKLESVIKAAPWAGSVEPNPLPKKWKKKRAKQSIIVLYFGNNTVTIPKGDIYFTYKGKVAIGWHGTYHPPSGM